MLASGTVMKATPPDEMPRNWSARAVTFRLWSTLMAATAARRKPLSLTVGQRAGTDRLAEQRREEPLLVLDPGQVGEGEGVPVPGVRQRGQAVHMVYACGQVKAAGGVIYRIGQADVHPAERIDDLDEAEEVDLDEVVDGQPCVLLHRLHHQLRATQAERSVDLVHAVPGDLHPRVPRQADDRHVASVA